MTSDRRLRFAMISTELRRDLDAPLKQFERVDVLHFYHHFYQGARTSDLGADEFGPHLIQYRSPRDLVAKLRHAAPDVVQGVEPFAVITLPYAAAVNRYLRGRSTPLVTVSLENVPLPRKYGRVPAAVIGAVARRTLARSDLVVAVNQGAGRNLLAYGASADRMTRLMYGCWGVDLDEFSPLGPSVTFRRGGEVTIIFIGRLIEGKGVLDLLEAFRASLDQTAIPLRLVFVGDGPLRPELERRIDAYGLRESVEFAGSVPNREVPTLLRGADLLAVPSRTTRMWAEQVGMVFLQAMGCGVPVISTRSGSIPEFVPDREVGLLVDEGDVNALARAMTELASNESLRAQFALRARQVAEERYDIAKNIRTVEDLIISLGKVANACE